MIPFCSMGGRSPQWRTVRVWVMLTGLALDGGYMVSHYWGLYDVHALPIPGLLNDTQSIALHLSSGFPRLGPHEVLEA
jgi:hypothetical protein